MFLSGLAGFLWVGIIYAFGVSAGLVLLILAFVLGRWFAAGLCRWVWVWVLDAVWCCEVSRCEFAWIWWFSVGLV